MHRVRLCLTSAVIVVGLTACCCAVPQQGPVIVANDGKKDFGAVPVPVPINKDGGIPIVKDGGIKDFGIKDFGIKDFPAKDFVPQPLPPVGDPAEQPAVQAVQKLGGAVVRDQGQPNLPVVEVNLIFKTVTDLDLRHLAPLTRLRKLELRNNPELTGIAFKDLAALANVEYIDVSFCQKINDAAVPGLLAFKKLKVLNLGATKVTDAGIRQLAALPDLEDVNLEGTGPDISDAGVKEFGKLTRLRKLDVGNTNTGDEALKALAGLPQLEALYLHGTRMTDTGMLELGRARKLQELAVGYSVTDKGMPAVANMTELKTLRLFNTQVSNEGLKQLYGLKNLREVDVAAARQITIAGVSQLQKALPGIKIKRK